MSSTKKNAESIASNIIILVDFDGAIVTEVNFPMRSGRRWLSILSLCCCNQRAGSLVFRA